MATVSGQLKDASINGKPRDLSSIISNIAPTDTPFLTMVGEGKASQTLHEWQTEGLAAPSSNAHLEGADVSSFAEETTTVESNHTQIITRAISVSGTAQAIVQAGVNRQYAHQMALQAKVAKKELEYALLSNTLDRAEASTNARLMRGLPTWFQTNYSGGASGAKADTSSSAACTAGTKRVPTEAMLKDLLTDIYNAGGNADCIMMSPAIRVKMSSVLGSGNTRMEKTEAKKATSVVDVYVSDFGSLKLVPNRVQSGVTYSADAAFVLDPSLWKVSYLRKWQERELSVTGDSKKGFILCEATLQATNEAGSGILADLKVSA